MIEPNNRMLIGNKNEWTWTKQGIKSTQNVKRWSICYPCIHIPGRQKRLFRKTKNLSSLFYPDKNKIRRNNKSYIYEEFVQSDGFDIKVYTVGEDYAHAEARKSPTLDGVVQRTIKGKKLWKNKKIQKNLI